MQGILPNKFSWMRLEPDSFELDDAVVCDLTSDGGGVNEPKVRAVAVELPIDEAANCKNKMYKSKISERTN